jgi:hypothetical protein
MTNTTETETPNRYDELCAGVQNQIAQLVNACASLPGGDDVDLQLVILRGAVHMTHLGGMKRGF